ncbi:MAG: hypothetical protein OK452_06405 [Thaumarchaeota archaeon]|nr:hypothetical protein [Nitrososphaerota archaeon]
MSLLALAFVFSAPSYAGAPFPAASSPSPQIPPIQVTLSISYRIVDGGTNYPPPLLLYFQNSQVQRANLTTSSNTVYTMDEGTFWNVSYSLIGTRSGEGWQTSTQTWGKATQGGLFLFPYYHQYLSTFRYSVAGSSMGFVPPKVWVISFGVNTSQTATWVGWVDAGTSYSYQTYVRAPSAAERWATASTSGVIAGPTDITPIYYHQYLTTVEYAVSGGGSPATPAINYVSLSRPLMGDLHNYPIQLWTDEHSKYAATNPIHSQNPNERWSAGTAVNGTVVTSSFLTITYYHQYAYAVNYAIVGGRSPTQITLTGSSSGSTLTLALTPLQQDYWLDAGSQYTTAQIIQATSGERWTSATHMSGTVNGPGQFTITYFHQYSLAVGYSMVGGGAASPPFLEYQTLGVQAGASLATSGLSTWADNGTVVIVTNPLVGSSLEERWAANAGPLVISAPVNLYLSYYHQFSVTFTYSWLNGESSAHPAVLSVVFGNAVLTQLTAQGNKFWIDAGSIWSTEGVIGQPSLQERWITSGTGGEAITGPGSFNLEYRHQYFVNVVPDPGAGGSVGAQSGWFDAGSRIAVGSTVNPGWKFFGWVGTGAGVYNGQNSSFALTVTGASSEKAEFYASVLVDASPDGSLNYAVGSKAGSLGTGSALQAYLPVGTLVTLRASASSPLNVFSGWLGGNFGSSNPLTFTVAGPTKVYASYAPNFLLRDALAAVIAGAMVAFVLYVYLKRELPFLRTTRRMREYLSRERFARVLTALR